MIFLLITCLFADVQMSGSADHDIHISKCIIEYSEKDEAFQIMMHVFVDDLELALKNTDQTELRLNTEKEFVGADDILLPYLRNRFQVSIDGELRNYEYIGREPSEDLQAVWIYLEIPKLPELSQVEISNTMLTELYDDQTNIVQIKSKGGKQAYFLLNRKKSTDSVNF